MASDLKEAVRGYLQARGDADGLFTTPIDGLALMKSSRETLPHRAIYRPALCVVAQGSKRVMVGDRQFDYGAMQSLIVSVEMPILGRVTRASDTEPFLGLVLDFDVTLMREVLDQLDTPPEPGADPGLGILVDTLDGPLSDCLVRLIRMLETPQAIAVLYPSVMREICFWLLTGRHGSEVCKLALPSGHTHRIAKAIHTLRRDFAHPIRAEQLAAAARMSPSSFYQHFKLLTSMTPLQYQKQLRLLEARRLMLADAVNATNAAYRVGYESASQFSREYTRLFGAPPRRDVSEQRGVPA
jgi:AraC-like DNA-binding protein